MKRLILQKISPSISWVSFSHQTIVPPWDCLVFHTLHPFLNAALIFAIDYSTEHTW